MIRNFILFVILVICQIKDFADQLIIEASSEVKKHFEKLLTVETKNVSIAMEQLPYDLVQNLLNIKKRNGFNLQVYTKNIKFNELAIDLLKTEKIPITFTKKNKDKNHMDFVIFESQLKCFVGGSGLIAKTCNSQIKYETFIIDEQEIVEQFKMRFKSLYEEEN